ncbi:P-loop containing nucleoside triphosphate hydrolase protein [Russula compacta]|nr:P-loop containing nucleoside triphosphate hydrolase protein [Russula compacta]
MSNYTSHSSYNILRTAWAKATKSYKYDSEETRTTIISKFKHTFNDKPPYDWQIDTCEALLLKLDCIVIAGTGAGKTLLFMVIIISLLNALEYDQKLGLSAAAVNGEVWSKSLHQDIINGRYQIVITSPEMTLDHHDFAQLIRSSTFMKNIALITINELHCVSQWGEGFWKRFTDLDQLQSFATCLELPGHRCCRGHVDDKVTQINISKFIHQA